MPSQNNRILSQSELNELILFRKSLHLNPELSGKEEQTSGKVMEMAVKYGANRIISGLGGHGVAVIFKGKEEKYCLLFRADMDALPIQETGGHNYRSQTDGIAHLCGHDGHTTILCGLMSVLSKNPIRNGTIILLFQPAEETGQGAYDVINDPKFHELKPDYVFALHNLPSFPMHSVIIRDESFASASKGMIIRLEGKSSHAAEPEKGINPGVAVSEIIPALINLPISNTNLTDFNLISLIHVKVGEIAFGTSASTAILMFTLRSSLNSDILQLTESAERICQQIATAHRLKIQIDYTEEFPATINDIACNEIIKKAANQSALPIKYPEKAFRWSEDFGHFTSKYQGSLFGIGSGENQPALHQSTYDFPDELINTGVLMFNNIISQFEE